VQTYFGHFPSFDRVLIVLSVLTGLFDGCRRWMGRGGYEIKGVKTRSFSIFLNNIRECRAESICFGPLTLYANPSVHACRNRIIPFRYQTDRLLDRFCRFRETYAVIHVETLIFNGFTCIFTTGVHNNFAKWVLNVGRLIPQHPSSRGFSHSNDRAQTELSMRRLSAACILLRA
jgi:hypothetical protein